MKTSSLLWNAQMGWKLTSKSELSDAHLVIAFGGRKELENADRFSELRRKFPQARILMASTAGEIAGTEVFDEHISVAALQLEHSSMVMAKVKRSDFNDSASAGMSLVGNFSTEGLRHIFVISDGHTVNGTELVQGMQAHLPQSVVLTGGLAGDGARFEKTLVGLDEAPSEGTIAAIGFYGERLRFGYGSQGGWDPFGPERVITRSTANILYELDGQPALELYKQYLGPKAAELPSSALLFPLNIRVNESDKAITRTILSIDEASGSMVFAGNMPEGARARLMKANFERIIDGAAQAAGHSADSMTGSEPDVAILISCVGRKLILGPRTEEEVESVAETLGGTPVITGFYSYGEIAPFFNEVKCELHNQTMTITTISEV